MTTLTRKRPEGDNADVPTPSKLPDAPGLGDPQRHLLAGLKRRGEATVEELRVAGLARETVRDHLKSLQARGLVERAGARRSGPGRPEVVYRLTGRGDELFPHRHGELLRELAEFLDDAGREGVLERFFQARGERKRREAGERLAGLEGEARRAEVAAFLSEQGFLAEVAEGGGAGERPRLRLCHCPWRDLVAVSRVPCRAEIALVSELLGEPLTRESFIPDGDSSCTYTIGPVKAPE
jgi:predicted ArsR family transcriptional regulator